MDLIGALQRINYASNHAYNRHISPGFGHIMLYQEKAEQAEDYITAGYPKKVSGYPLIEIEAKVTNRSPKEVADSIMSAKSEWIALATKIEETRLTAKQELYNTESNDELPEIVEKYVTLLDEI